MRRGKDWGCICIHPRSPAKIMAALAYRAACFSGMAPSLLRGPALPTRGRGGWLFVVLFFFFLSGGQNLLCFNTLDAITCSALSRFGKPSCYQISSGRYPKRPGPGLVTRQAAFLFSQSCSDRLLAWPRGGESCHRGGCPTMCATSRAPCSHHRVASGWARA